MIKLFLGVAFATALMGSLAFAQTSSSTTVATHPNGVTEANTTTESFGTVTEFTPGDSLNLKTEATEPKRYTFSKAVEYVNADGKVIEPSKIRKDSKVRVHYLKQGDNMVVDKVILTPERHQVPVRVAWLVLGQASNSAPDGWRTLLAARRFVFFESTL